MGDMLNKKLKTSLPCLSDRLAIGPGQEIFLLRPRKLLFLPKFRHTRLPSYRHRQGVIRANAG